jgi:hypothetical protein
MVFLGSIREEVAGTLSSSKIGEFGNVCDRAGIVMVRKQNFKETARFSPDVSMIQMGLNEIS